MSSNDSVLLLRKTASGNSIQQGFGFSLGHRELLGGIPIVILTRKGCTPLWGKIKMDLLRRFGVLGDQIERLGDLQISQMD